LGAGLGSLCCFFWRPTLNLLRFDLTETQLWFFGMRWSLGIDAFIQGDIDATTAALQIVLRAFLPGIALVVIFLTVAYRYGRLYCGWLCPHFSVVESLNNLLHRACGKLSLWDTSPVSRANTQPNARWWPIFGLSCVLMGFLWSVTLLTYLLPPATIWGGLLHGTLTANQARFIGIGGLIVFRRICLCPAPVLPLWLRCRPVSKPGLDGQPRGMVVAFDRLRARDCKTATHPWLSLRQRLPDAPETAQHQTHDVLMCAVRAVPERLRHIANRTAAHPYVAMASG
jgi:ferredoxin-type protein NapH